MNKERLIQTGLTAAGIIALWNVAHMALTKKQRESILERDDYEGQARTYNEDEGWHQLSHCADPENPCTSLHVHHILPQRMGGEDDDPDNLITVPECIHIGRCRDGRVDPDKAL